MMMAERGYRFLGYTAFFAFVVGLAFVGTDINIVVIGSALLYLLMQSLRKSPNGLLVFWLVGVAAFPPWIPFYAVGYRLPAAALISVACIAAAGRNKTKFVWVDGAVIALVLSTAVGTMFFQTPLHIATQALLEWGLCYAAGRILFCKSDLPAICNRVGGVLGLLACLQFLLQFNVASFFPFSVNASGSQWSVLQERGGSIRSELAFGHSISLGAVLVILLAFGLKNRARYSYMLSALTILGVLTTFSRSAIAATVITVILTILRSKAASTGKSIAIVLCGFIAYVVASRFVAVVNGAENSVELTDSTDYREGLLSLFSIVDLVGLAPGGLPSSLGVTYTWDNFYSIDNGFLFVGLYSGAIAMALYAAIPLSVVLSKKLKNWDSFSTFIIAQIPFLVTVAPITQYQNYYWLFLGMGVSSLHASGSGEIVKVSASEVPVAKNKPVRRNAYPSPYSKN
ncbi:hypothetical protein HQ312_19470 [Rhodococcus sp. BP-316]|uniref:hypothetical protein n=1 Tax=Rhodococcus sp. BP-316 TaxID=2739445 RepID=UPI001C9AB305|nr:hypothetical protein [Rhodococcus sp. BP-316]MBY6683243.1 hypothetical protein [Rhodococcus sp. BP-316]